MKQTNKERLKQIFKLAKRIVKIFPAYRTLKKKEENGKEV